MVGRLGWLKARLLWNGLRADRQRRIGLPLTFGLLAWASAEIATRYHAAFTDLSAAAAVEMSAWGALAFFLVWISLPVVIFPIDEGLDPAQFGLAPISGPQLLGGLSLAALISPSMVIPAVALAVDVYEWRRVWPAALVSAVLMLALLVVAGQLFTAALSSVLRSRRGRDLSVLIVAAIGLFAFAGQQVVRATVHASGLERAVLENGINHAWYLPPIAVHRIVTETAGGRPGPAFLFALLSVAWIGVLAVGWHRLLQHLLTTPEQSAQPRNRTRSNSGLTGRLGWTPTLVMARKELRFYIRDPRQRLVWTGAAIFVGLALSSILVGTSTFASFQTRAWLPLFAPVLVLFVGLPIALNLFGWERNAASFLFVLPTRPRRLLAGKNLAAATALAVETLVMATILAVLSGAWSVLPMVPALAACAIGCQLAVGNLVSVVTPLRLPREGTDVFAQATEQGCLAIGAQLVSFMTIGALLVIPASVTVLAVIFDTIIQPWMAAGFAVVWGAFFYGISLLVAGKILERRLPEVAQWVQVV